MLCPGPVNTRVHEERYRPSASKRVDAERPEKVARMAAMKEMLARAMSPRAVGECVVEAVLEDRFFIFSNPEFAPGVEPRFDEIRRQLT